MTNLVEAYLPKYNLFNNLTIKKIISFSKTGINFYNSTINSDAPMTEFDGAFLLYDTDKPKYLIIIEAKHAIDVQKINRKIIQIYYIKKLLNDKKINKGSHKFKNFDSTSTIDSNIINDIEEIDDIFLFIGAPFWIKDSIKYIKELNNGNRPTLDLYYKKLIPHYYNPSDESDIIKNIKSHIIYILPQNDRYFLYDETDSIVGPIDFSLGGKKIYKKTRMIRGPKMILCKNFDPERRKKIENLYYL